MLKTKTGLDINTIRRAFELMATAKSMTDVYEENAAITRKYVHATSRGHEAVQIALGLQLLPVDFVSPYYRDDSILLAIGMRPYELMLQLLSKREDPFSGGRSYYSHPSLKDADKPKIIHQSSATGMQAIPATGIALGIWYKEMEGLATSQTPPVAVCSLGDGSMTEGEVAEAMQMAALKSLPILYFVQDNEWDISAYRSEVRRVNAAEYARGFEGIEAVSVDGTDFRKCYLQIREILNTMRTERRPFLLHASVPLLNHHTSGVRMEWYRDDLDASRARDPYPKLRALMYEMGIDAQEVKQIETQTRALVEKDFQKAKAAEDPHPKDLFDHIFAPTPITEETGIRAPEGSEVHVMVDSALHAINQILRDHPEALLYGQDVGKRLGGVFREAALLAKKYGDHRVFNTPIQEAFIVGSTAGMSAVGLKPIVEVQFADYIWPGLNQLFTEISRSYYLSNGKWPVQMVLRVPTGAYGSGGPFHSTSLESVITNIRGIKIAYPSTGADLFGLMKSAWEDPNPVVILEHKALYWSKIPGTSGAKTPLPSEDYRIPFGKARVVCSAHASRDTSTLSIITYGMGVYWAEQAAKDFDGRIEIIDLRTLFPLDIPLLETSLQKHGRGLIVTEEPVESSFAQSLAGRLQASVFEYLDAPIQVIGSENLPAIPLNQTLEQTMLPNAQKLKERIHSMLTY